jgi:hypothetical protein
MGQPTSPSLNGRPRTGVAGTGGRRCLTDDTVTEYASGYRAGYRAGYRIGYRRGFGAGYAGESGQRGARC